MTATYLPWPWRIATVIAFLAMQWVGGCVL